MDITVITFLIAMFLIGIIAILVCYHYEMKAYRKPLFPTTLTKEDHNIMHLPTTEEMDTAFNDSFIGYTTTWMDDTDLDEDGYPKVKSAHVSNLRDALIAKAGHADDTPVMHMDLIKLDR